MSKVFLEAFIGTLNKLANGDDDENKGTKPTEKAVLEFIKRHPRPSDDAMHEWAEGKGHNVHKAESTAYGIISDLLNKGRSKGNHPAGVAPKDVSKGVDIESEHTPNKMIQRKITDDHNTELKKYYDKKKGLPALEKSLDKKAAFTGAFVDELDKLSGNLGIKRQFRVARARMRAGAKGSIPEKLLATEGRINARNMKRSGKRRAWAKSNPEAGFSDGGPRAGEHALMSRRSVRSLRGAK